MFTGMRAQNFKSWQDTGEIRLAPLTGFFGPNSSGKTSLLQMLLVWKQTVESADLNQILLTDGPYANLGTIYDLMHQRKGSGELHFSFSLEPSSPEPVLFIPPHPLDIEEINYYDLQFHIAIEANEKSIRVKRFKYHVNSLSSPTEFGIGMQYETTYGARDQYELIFEDDLLQKPSPDKLLDRPTKSYGFPYLSVEETGLHNVSALAQTLERAFRNIFYLGPLRTNFHRTYLWSGEIPRSVGNQGELTIPALITSYIHSQTDGSKAGVDEVVADWLESLGLIYSFRLQPIAEGRREYEVLVKVTPQSAEVPITDVGFGISQILPVLTLCYYAHSDATIILEQPELHLHPLAQAGLADVLIDAIDRREVQIILESHSEHLLRRLQRRMAEKKIHPDNVALYFVRMENDKSRLEELKLDEYGNILNWPENFFGNELEDMGAMLEAEMKRKLEQNGQ